MNGHRTPSSLAHASSAHELATAPRTVPAPFGATNFDVRISVPPPSGTGLRPLPNATFGKKILIVDDNRLVRAATRRALLAHGFTVFELASAEGVETAAAALAPDLVLMDVEMPMIDGREATVLVHDSVPDLPVVLYSALPPNQLTQIAASCGAQGSISKGQPLLELLGVLEAQLR